MLIEEAAVVGWARAVDDLQDPIGRHRRRLDLESGLSEFRGEPGLDRLGRRRPLHAGVDVARPRRSARTDSTLLSRRDTRTSRQGACRRCCQLEPSASRTPLCRRTAGAANARIRPEIRLGLPRAAGFCGSERAPSERAQGVTTREDNAHALRVKLGNRALELDRRAVHRAGLRRFHLHSRCRSDALTRDPRSVAPSRRPADRIRTL